MIHKVLHIPLHNYCRNDLLCKERITFADRNQMHKAAIDPASREQATADPASRDQ